MLKKKDLGGSWMCILAALIWGAAFVAQTEGMEHVGPFTFHAVRSLIGSAALLPVCLLFGKERPAENWHRKKVWGLPALVFYGTVSGLALYTACITQQVGLQYTTVGRSGFITALYVILVPLSGLIIGKRPRKTVWICAAIAVAGLWLLCGAGRDGGGFGKGELLTMVCALTFTLDIRILDVISGHFNSFWLSFTRFAVNAVVGCVIMFLTETPTLQAVLSAALPLLYAGVMSSSVAYTLQVNAQRRTDPTIASILFCLESVFSAIFGWLMLGQNLSGPEIAGCALMFGAVVLATVAGTEKEA